MALPKYRTNQPFFVGGVYTFANHQNPVDFTLPADVEPSRSWEPLNKEAEAAIEALLTKPKVSPVEKKSKFAKIPLPDDTPPVEANTLAEIQKVEKPPTPKIEIKAEKSKRASDKDIY